VLKFVILVLRGRKWLISTSCQMQYGGGATLKLDMAESQ